MLNSSVIPTRVVIRTTAGINIAALITSTVCVITIAAIFIVLGMVMCVFHRRTKLSKSPFFDYTASLKFYSQLTSMTSILSYNVKIHYRQLMNTLAGLSCMRNVIVS